MSDHPFDPARRLGLEQVGAPVRRLVRNVATESLLARFAPEDLDLVRGLLLRSIDRTPTASVAIARMEAMVRAGLSSFSTSPSDSAALEALSLVLREDRAGVLTMLEGALK